MFPYFHLNTTNDSQTTKLSINWTEEKKTAYEPPFPFTLTIILAILAGIVSLCTISGNIMVLVAFMVERNIRTASNYFIASLAATDLLIGLFSMNLFTAYLLLGYWPLGNILCDIWLSLDYTACLTSQYTVLFITLDRFFSVRVPVRYRNWRTNTRVRLMVAITWIVPSALFFTSIMGWRHFTGEQLRKAGECFAEFTSYPIFITVLTVWYFWVTLIVMVGLYMGIYKAAWKLHVKNQNRHKNMTSLMAMASQTMSQIGVGMTWKASDNNHNSCPEKCDSNEQQRLNEDSYTSIPSRKDKDKSNSKTIYCYQSGSIPKICRFDVHSQQENPKITENKSENPNIKVKITKEREISEGYTSTLASSSERIHQRYLNSPPEDFHELKYIDEEFDALLNSPSSEIENLLSSFCPDFIRGSINSNVRFNLSDVSSNHISSKACNGIFTDSTTKSSSVTTSIRDVAKKINARRNHSIGILDMNSARSENRARKALRTISFILGAFVLCWTPFHILVLVKSFCNDTNLEKPCVNDHVYNLAYWLCYLNSPINPFCYALANAQFKMAFKRVLKGELRSQ